MIQNRREKQRGAPVVSVLFDIHPNDKPNNHMEILIKEFEKVYEKDLRECEATQRRQRKLEAKMFDLFAREEDKAAFSTLLNEPEEASNIFESNLRAARRRAQEDRTWDVWHESIIKTFWFYGYEGSLTEPPCSEFGEFNTSCRFKDSIGLLMPDFFGSRFAHLTSLFLSLACATTS